MQSIIPQIKSWVAAGKSFALARVLSTWGSSPRRPGAAMIISAEGEVHGSVSGGCVESAVIEEALQVLQTGKGKRLEYGIEDETAWSVGLSCGGQLSVWVEPFWSATEGGAAVWDDLLSAMAAKQPAVIMTVLEPDEEPVLWPHPEESTGEFEVEGVEVFIHVFPVPPRVILLGAGHVTVPLLQYLEVLGMNCLVIDPREVFTQRERFGEVSAEILTGWPQELFPTLDIGPTDYIVLLTHDSRIDDPALSFVLRKEVAYIGALGSRKSHKARRLRLLQAGFSDAEIDQIHAPIGLNIGGRSPEEIAMSIAAEIVSVRNGKS